MPNITIDLDDLLHRREANIIAAASRLLAARVMVCGSPAPADDEFITWSVREAMQIAMGVREDIERFLAYMREQDGGESGVVGDPRLN